MYCAARDCTAIYIETLTGLARCHSFVLFSFFFFLFSFFWGLSKAQASTHTFRPPIHQKNMQRLTLALADTKQVVAQCAYPAEYVVGESNRVGEGDFVPGAPPNGN